MNTSLLEMTGSFQKDGRQVGAFKKEQIKGQKPSLDYGRSTLSKTY